MILLALKEPYVHIVCKETSGVVGLGNTPARPTDFH